MNKEELVKEVSKKAKVSQKATADILAATLDTIQKTVSKGKKVTLVGFGTFEPRKRAARNGRNPQTGKEIKIPAKTVPVFSAGKSICVISPVITILEPNPNLVRNIFICSGVVF